MQNLHFESEALLSPLDHQTGSDRQSSLSLERLKQLKLFKSNILELKRLLFV